MTQPGKIEIIEEETLDTPKTENIQDTEGQNILSSQKPSSSQTVQPPFPKRLEMKEIMKQAKFYLVSELRNVCINISLL